VTRTLAWTALTVLACHGDAREVARAHRDTEQGAAIGSAATDPKPTDGDAGSPSLPPLAGFFEALAVTGHHDAWMSLPTGATGKRPVVVVIHGAGDRPDWQCGGWRRATGKFPFVVCPRGADAPADSTKRDARYTHRGGAALLAYIDESLAALEAKYPDYADTTTPILAGFSLGASEILALALQAPGRFPRIALVEGATRGWTDAQVDAYLAGGGRRVLYATGQRVNDVVAKTTVKHLLAKGLAARAVYAPVNHTFDPPLEDAVRGDLGWFVEGDRRWPPL
jgi:pimeloyl-ACP methyl ester carboxylesterase